MLSYCGHPFVDVGVATMAAFARKQNPSQLTDADVEKVVEYISYQYVRPPLKSFLTVAFTANAWFSQNAYNPDQAGLSVEESQKRKHKREKVRKAHLREWSIENKMPTREQDVFTGEAVITIQLSSKLPLGRAGRAQVPLALGDEVINFYPYGTQGLPISGSSLLSLQAFPLGCAKCGKGLLAVHSDNDELTLHFARTFLTANRKAVQLAQMSNSKMPGSHLYERTLLIDILLEANELQNDNQEDEELFSLTAYHFSNGKEPMLDIYYLPLQIVAFLREMHSAKYKQDWQVIVHRAWEVPAPEKKGKKDKKSKKGKEKAPFEPRRNWLYEDLFGLPEKAHRFLRTYLLREALQYARGEKHDPRDTYSLKNEIELVSWKITERFLWRVMNMDKERIAQIRAMGDRLAAYVSQENDKRFFRRFFTEQRYDHLRTSLIKANLKAVQNGYEPLVTLDPYIEVFEEGDELAYSQWRLARDLVLIRMVEQLHEQGWFDKNADAIPDVSDEDEADNNNE